MNAEFTDVIIHARLLLDIWPRLVLLLLAHIRTGYHITAKVARVRYQYKLHYQYRVSGAKEPNHIIFGQRDDNTVLRALSSSRIIFDLEKSIEV